MIYEHYSDYTGPWLWDNFSAKELSCPCCGEYYHSVQTLNQIQYARQLIGKALTINSAHRCRKHNREVGGAIASEHLRIALDVSIVGHDGYTVLGMLKAAGFTTFGFYKSFIHTDIRYGRRWFGAGAKSCWTEL